MNPAIQCIILLVSVAICTSMTIKNCQCVTTSRGVKPSLMADVKEYPLRPYCNKVEVIAKLKDNTFRCLDPNSRFTKIVLERIRNRKEALAKTNAIASSANTTPATASA